MNALRVSRSSFSRALVFVCAILCSGVALAQSHPLTSGAPLNRRQPAAPFRLIGEGLGGFQGTLAPGAAFGDSIAALGDFDKNGVPDMAVTGWGGPGGGALWLLFLDSDGGVIAQRKISPGTSGFTVDLAGLLIASVDRLGDLDGDGVTELLLGCADCCYQQPGCVFVLFLNADGTVKRFTRIDPMSGSIGGELFGFSVACLGDLDGDGLPEVAVGSYGATVLFLDASGSVRTSAFVPAYADSVARLGDFDGDGVEDLLVGGVEQYFEGELGHLQIALLRPDGTARAFIDHDAYTLGITDLHPCSSITPDHYFSRSVASLGDMDGDGTTDVAVGAPSVDDFCCDSSGSVWILGLRSPGTVVSQYEITNGSQPYRIRLPGDDQFGEGLACLGDVNGDGRPDLAVGSPNAFASGCSTWDGKGAVRLLFGVP